MFLFVDHQRNVIRKNVAQHFCYCAKLCKLAVSKMSLANRIGLLIFDWPIQTDKFKLK